MAKREIDAKGYRAMAHRIVSRDEWVAVSAGIDMSLHVVRKLLGKEIATKTCHQMEYAWS